jgi:glucan phosphoethanolaminetransferase (alkaline phosphatase superfamily)
MFLPPDLTKYLAENLFKGNKVGAIVVVGVVFAFIIFATSGLWSTMLPTEMFEKMSDVMVTVVVIILFAIPIIFITWGGGKEAPTPEVKKEGEKGG